MSQFFLAQNTTTASINGFQKQNELSLVENCNWEPLAESKLLLSLIADRQFEDALLWPRARWSGGEMGMGILQLDSAFTGRFETNANQRIGAAGTKRIAGVTRDSGGSPLGSCVVRAYLTTGDVFVGQVTSDSGGYFEVPTIWTGANHYLVAYKPGSPDVAGSTLNTLTPT